jgi:hypothetical protein
MAFYFAEQGRLVAHGLQVRAGRNDTVGEFDFLLDAGPDFVEHIEFATKFYLLQGEDAAGDIAQLRQLRRPQPGRQPGRARCARCSSASCSWARIRPRSLLPRPVTRAKALVKGWLFYPAGTGRRWPASRPATAAASGARCRAGADGRRPLPDPAALQWLAPFRASSATWMLDRAQLPRSWTRSSRPRARRCWWRWCGAAGSIVETERGFIVPDDWRERAGAASKVRAPFGKDRMQNII